MNTPTQVFQLNHLLLWLLIVLVTSGYFSLYDSFYLSHQIDFLSAFISSAKAWLVWLIILIRIEQQLSAQGSIRVHRSYLINTARVPECAKLHIYVRCGTAVAMGRYFQSCIENLRLKHTLTS